jgi:predicted O-methyltransferase YrrM
LTTRSPLTTSGLVGILFGAGAFQMLAAGCEFGLFALLDQRPGLTADQIGERLGLKPRPVQILLLGTTALGLTAVTAGAYRNGALVDELIGDGTWDIIVDLVAFQDQITGPAALDFVASLRGDTNVGLRRLAGDGTDLYHRLAADSRLEQLFYRCMRSWSKLSNPILARCADLSAVRRVLDVGGGDAVNSIALALANPDARFTVVDLPGAAAIARQRVAAHGLGDRIDVRGLDMFAQEYPGGHDCVLFANQLVIWSPQENLTLLRKAYQALPDGGRVLIFNAFADETGDGPLYAALDNVYFATLPSPSSMVYHWGQYEQWLTDAGFTKIVRIPGGTWTPHGLIEAIK